jgi:lysophospholipase L1-like esterase
MRIAAAAAVLAVLAFGLLHRELPAWRPGGSVSWPAAALGFDPPASLCPPGLARIELRGDSLVIGARMGDGTGAAAPYGTVLARELGPGVSVVLRGRGGATAADGERAWRASASDGEIVLLAYGTNDAAVRGWIGGKTPVPLTQFRRSLAAHLDSVRRGGAAVGLIAPPPTGSAAMMERLEPYRREVARLGREEGIPVFDPAEAFAGCRIREPLLSSDALHLNRAGHDCLGRWLARKLCR